MSLNIILLIVLIGKTENISFLWVFNNYLTNSLNMEILIALNLMMTNFIAINIPNGNGLYLDSGFILPSKN